MANEITLTGSAAYSKNGVSRSLSMQGVTIDGGDNPIANVQIIGTSEEQVLKGDIGTIKCAQFKNLDATNFVEIGFATGVYPIKLLPGKGTGPMPLNCSTVYLKADTAACNVEVFLSN